jgi:hypothetical protein
MVDSYNTRMDLVTGRKIVVRCPRTRLYLTETLDWTISIVQANNFPSAKAAEQFCLQRKLTGLDIWLLREGRTPLRYTI